MANEVQITQYRPERRFGAGFRIWQRDWHSGEVQQLRIEQNGDSHWETVDKNVETPPTMILDDDVIDALANHLLQERPPPEGLENQLRQDIEDSRGTRDRLLTLVEKVVKSS